MEDSVLPGYDPASLGDGMATFRGDIMSSLSGV
jgi:hypothetical protein